VRGGLPAATPTALLLLLLPACRGPVPPGTWLAPSPEVDALLREAERALLEDRPTAAGAAAARASEAAPGSPDALRMVQAARVAAGDDVGARRGAVEAAARRPDDPTALYLLARTEADGRDAARLLRRAVEGDPGLLWARLGLVQLHLARRDADAATAELDAAEATAPSHPWVWILRAQVKALRKDPDLGLAELLFAASRDPDSYRAREALARLLRRLPGSGAAAREECAACFRLAPRSPVAAAAWREALGDDAPPRDLRAAVEAVDAAEASGAAGPAARHLRGAALLLLGDADAALPDLRAAVEALEDRTGALDDLRLALFRLGRYGEALDAEESSTPPGVLDDPGAETAPLRAALRRTADALASVPEDPGLLAALTAQCRAAGWHREAALLAARRVAADPSDAGARGDAAEAARTALFLDDLRRFWAGAYHSYAGGAAGEGIDGALAALRAISLRRLGLDVTEGIARRSFPLLGEVAESVRATGPCAAWFRRNGLALLVGSVGGEPVEARLVRVLSVRRDIEESILGRRFPVTVVVGEGLLVPSRREVGGAVLGGATVGDLVFVDLEGVGRWTGAALRARRNGDLRAALAAAPREVTAADEAEALSLRLAGRLTDRVALSVDAWDDPRRALADFLDAARCHEYAHAADSARYLPALLHPIEGLRLLLRGGLSPAGAVAVLEGDAEIAALAACREPRASLATLVSYLPGRDAAPPHSRGYHGAIEDLVGVLRERGALPGDAVAVRLLDGLDPGVLRSAAREVCRRRGVRR